MRYYIGYQQDCRMHINSFTSEANLKDLKEKKLGEELVPHDTIFQEEKVQ